MKEKTTVMVLGGGIAGLTAADALARNDVPVILLERENQLGGQAIRWACMATEKCQKCSVCLITDLKRNVLENTFIQVYTQANLEEVGISKDSVHVQVRPGGNNGTGSGQAAVVPEGLLLKDVSQWEIDALFVATGFTPFSAREKPMLHYGELNAVITTEDLNQLLTEHRLDTLAVQGQEKAKIAFLQCVGSRDREAGRDYCSQVCCKTSLRQAARLLVEKPDWEITLFYIDLQLFGKGFRSFCNSFKERIRVVQGVPSEVLPAAEDSVFLVFEDPKTGNSTTENFGLVVLAVGMMPAPGAKGLADMLSLSLDEGGFFQKMPEEIKSRLYTMGACCSPMDIVSARRQALNAVGRFLAK